MKQTIKIGMVLLVALAVALGWSMVSSSKKSEGTLKKLVAEKELMARELSSQEADFNEMMQMINEVEEQIEAIVEKENLVLNTQPGEYLGDREKLLKEIAMIDALVVRSNKSIKELSGKLESAGIRTNVMQNKVNKLTAELNERVAFIETLKADLEIKENSLKELNAKVVDLEKEGAAQALKIDEKTSEIERLLNDNKELNKVHLAVGTYQELKTKGLVQREGGFLMFGGKVSLAEDANPEEFLEIDSRQFRKLPIEAKKLKLVSDHPSDSFVIVDDEENEELKYLEILDSDKFWKISKYLVVSVK